MEQKPTNPKDALAVSKLPLYLVPSSLEVYACLAFAEGALKYGAYNWRVAGVRLSVYLSAIKRHYDKFQNGEWEDQVTKVPHLASIIACSAIILDARLCDKLIDDRPPTAPVSPLIDELEDHIKSLKVIFADHNPKQYTILDSPSG